MNQVIRPFTFLIPSCDESVQEINTAENYFIAMDMESGYWQVVVEEEARKRLALFTPDGERQWKVMPMAK